MKRLGYFLYTSTSIHCSDFRSNTLDSERRNSFELFPVRIFWISEGKGFSLIEDYMVRKRVLLKNLAIFDETVNFPSYCFDGVQLIGVFLILLLFSSFELSKADVKYLSICNVQIT